MKVMGACIGGMKDRESCFHQWGGAVDLVQSSVREPHTR